MKVVVADPVVPRRVTESLSVVVPAAVEELIVAAISLFYKYPAVTAVNRISIGNELFHILVASYRYRYRYRYLLTVDFCGPEAE